MNSKTRANEKQSAAIADSIEAAHDANLKYVTDTSAGLSRKKSGKDFVYLTARGQRVRDAETLGRIRSLVIPPAWKNVWICPSANGHLQAVGRDARGRKQYRYHPKYRSVRDDAKYSRMMAFAHALPKIHRVTARDLRKKGLPREKVLAAVIRVMQKTLIRVGNEEYAEQNDSYGLTTLEDRHARIRGGNVHFHFRGKSGIDHEIDLNDKRLAKIVKKCQDLPGEQLFQYRDEAGKVVDIDSKDVNDYLRGIAGEAFTVKDFRTWAGTVLAAKALRAIEVVDSNAARKKNVVRAIEAVAQRLGNTKAVCRKCYIHPRVIETYLDGSLESTFAKAARQTLQKSLHDLSPEEAAVLVLLQQKLEEKSPRSRSQ